MPEETPTSDPVLQEEAFLSGLPSYLQQWVECLVIVCTNCYGRPLLCKNNLFEHLETHHAHDGALEKNQTLRTDLLDSKMVATTIDGISLPLPYLPKRYLLDEPEKGYVCAALPCSYAHRTLEAVVQHEIQEHCKLQERLEERVSVLVQYVSLDEPYFFPVKWEDADGFGHSEPISPPISSLNGASPLRSWIDRANLLNSLPDRADLLSVPLPG